jgi:hypothetical protein
MIGISGGCCEYSNETSGSIKYGEFLDKLGSYKLFKKNCAGWSWLDGDDYIIQCAFWPHP